LGSILQYLAAPLDECSALHETSGMSLILSKEELVVLTGRERPTAQVRVLRHLGICHNTRPDGSLVVDRSHYETIVRGAASVAPPSKRAAINWN
jgi:Domain of unknown function (DUF4224)